MKITKSQLKQIIKEELEEAYGGRSRGGFGNMTVGDIERMLPPGVIQKYPGASRILQKRALEAGLTTKELADKIEAAQIRHGEHPSNFFSRLGFKW
jgi:hypothetical protein